MPERFQVVGQFGRFYVTDTRYGEALSGIYPSVDRARTRADALNAEMRMTVRKCMCCRQAFRSEGKHNRLCVKCRRGSDPFDRRAGVGT